MKPASTSSSSPSRPVHRPSPPRASRDSAGPPALSLVHIDNRSTTAPAAQGYVSTPGASNLPLALLDHLCPGLVGEVRRELGLRASLFPAHQRETLVEALVNRILKQADQLPADAQAHGPRQLQVRLFEEASGGGDRVALYVAAWEARSPPPLLAPMPPVPQDQWRPDDPLSTGQAEPDFRRAQIVFRIRLHRR